MADTPAFETRTPEQLQRASAISPNALTTVQEPGGPVQSLEISKLLGKLISTNAAFETQAARDANLNFVANSIALTYADPDPAKNGWSRKVGASGAGSWALFEKLSAQAASEAAVQVALAVAAKDAAEAAAASVIVQSPSYDNPGGKGNRTASVSITASAGLFSSGTLSTAIDGDTATNGPIPTASLAVAGHNITLDFLYGADRASTEVKLHFSNSAERGNWKARTSRDGVTWANVSNDFAFGGAAVITQAVTAAKGFRYLQFYGMSGNIAAASQGALREIEIKIVGTQADGLPPLPLGGSAGQTIERTPGVDGSSEWIDPKEPVGRSLLNHLWLCDEGHGTLLRDSIGGVHFNLAGGANEVNIGVGGSIAWIDGVLTLNYGAISTGAKTVTAQTCLIFYESVVDAPHFLIGLGQTNNQISTHQWSGTTGKNKMLHGRGVRSPWRHGTTQVGFECGGVSGGLAVETGSVTGHVVINANRNTDWAGINTNLAQPLKIYAIATMAGEPTNEQAAQLQAFFDWHLAKRGRYLTDRYCPRRCAVAVWTGESTHHATLLLDTNFSEAERKAKNYDRTQLIAEGPSVAVTGPVSPLQRLSYWVDKTWSGYNLGNEGGRLDGSDATGDRNRKAGVLYGFAEKEGYANTPREHPIFHFKLARGGTHIAPGGSALAAGGTLPIADTFGTDASGPNTATLFGPVQLRGFGKMEAQLRSSGCGIDYITRYDARGGNDTNNLAAGVIANAATYQGWLQTEHDEFKKFIGVTALPTFTRLFHLPNPANPVTYAGQLGQPGVTGTFQVGPAGQVQVDNLINVRNGTTLHDTLNADVTAVSVDHHEFDKANGDWIHHAKNGYFVYGGECRGRFSFAAKLTPLVDMS